MVVVYISGGLANKMFQYAFSLRVVQSGYQVAYDTKSFQTEFKHDQIGLGIVFPNIKTHEVSGTPFRYIGKRDMLSRIARRIFGKYIFEVGYRYNSKAITSLSKNCCIDGLWQDPRYFNTCEENVQEAFEFRELVNEKNLILAKQMQNENSIAIHLRKGDGYSTWDQFKNTCTRQYYVDAINHIQEYVDDPVYYVFTDSPELLQEFLPISNYTLVDWNPTSGPDNYIDMQLMSLVKHNIIANSTYSWWGAWLNGKDKKIVIAPKHWFNPEMKKFRHYSIVPDGWIKL